MSVSDFVSSCVSLPLGRYLSVPSSILEDDMEFADLRDTIADSLLMLTEFSLPNNETLVLLINRRPCNGWVVYHSKLY